MSCPGQGLPAQNGSQAQALDVPAIPGRLPHLLLCNLPRDCLYSFDRQASRCSLQPHRWGPPLISSPTLQLGRSRARPSLTPSNRPLSPRQLILQENRHLHVTQSFLSATDIRGLSPIESRGWEARGVKTQDPACPSVAKSGEDGVEGSQPNPPQLVPPFSWLGNPFLPFQILAASALGPATDLAFPKRTSCFRARTESCRSMQERAAWINKTEWNLPQPPSHPGMHLPWALSCSSPRALGCMHCFLIQCNR